jgi:prophage regulatory protein
MSTTEILRRDRQRRAAKHKEGDERSILRLRDVEVKTGIKRSAIYQAIAEGTFPKSVPLTERAVGWVSSEIDDWIEGRITARAEHNHIEAAE